MKKEQGDEEKEREARGREQKSGALTRASGAPDYFKRVL